MLVVTLMLLLLSAAVGTLYLAFSSGSSKHSWEYENPARRRCKACGNGQDLWSINGQDQWEYHYRLDSDPDKCRGEHA